MIPFLNHLLDEMPHWLGSSVSARITSMHVQAWEAVQGGQHHHAGLRLLGFRVVKGLRFKVGLIGLSGFSVGMSAPSIWGSCVQVCAFVSCPWALEDSPSYHAGNSKTQTLNLSERSFKWTPQALLVNMREVLVIVPGFA